MQRKKLLPKILTATILVGGINFSPAIVSFDAENLQIISIANAEVKTYIATDSAMFDFGEDDEQIINTVKGVAKMRAEQAAKEKAGVFIKSRVQTANGVLTDEDIFAVTNNISEIVDVQYKKIPVQIYNAKCKETGKIGFLYEATITVKIDTSGISEYVLRSEQEKSNLIFQNQSVQNSVKEISKHFENLRKNVENKNVSQIKSDLQKIDNELLARQKFVEGNKFIYYHDYQVAIFKYNESLEISPIHEEVYLNRGAAYIVLKNYAQAINDLNKTIEINSNLAEAYCNRGTAYRELQNYQQAILDYTQAIKINQNYSMAYYNRGLAYKDLKNYSQAILDYTQAIKLNLNYAEAYHNRGVINGILKNYDAAIEDFTKAIELNPDIAEAYGNRGRAYEELGQYDKAEADFAKESQLE